MHLWQSVTTEYQGPSVIPDLPWVISLIVIYKVDIEASMVADQTIVCVENWEVGTSMDDPPVRI